jgi:hypothetical protein
MPRFFSEKQQAKRKTKIQMFILQISRTIQNTTEEAPEKNMEQSCRRKTDNQTNIKKDAEKQKMDAKCS